MGLRAAVIGAGSWGTTVASILSANTQTILWAREPSIVDAINAGDGNQRYLPGMKLHAQLKATSNIQEAVADADLVVMAVPAKAMRASMTQLVGVVRPWVPIISLAKGFEQETGLRMTQVIEEIAPNHPVGVLTGPNLAREIIQGYAAASVLAMVDDGMMRNLKPLFETARFRIYTNTDVIGCELGGALKNVIAIAAGMSDGAGAGDNTRAALITRGLAEVTRLGVAMGGAPQTFAGLAGLGDLMVTCTSTLSRNHFVGVELGKGKSIETIIAEMDQVAEGVNSSRIVMRFSEQFGINMPIARSVYEVCHENSTAARAFRGLLRFGAASEAEPG